ncbi:MAG TPA: hypothetical protein VFO16_15535, partial [Pseudonocardiaceae bacterium]|nr:hypothetical protein [Pseudonocardiaceae bacterium]
MSTVVIVSFRLGMADGVSVAAAQWVTALRQMGLRVHTVAGEGAADRLVPGLALGSPQPARPADLADALRGADLVV